MATKSTTTKKDTRVKVNADQIYKQIGKGRTVQDLADSFTVTPATVRKYVKDLVEEKRIVPSGTRSTGERGRPATIYVQAQ